MEEEIFSVYGLPPGLLQGESSLKTSIETQLKIFEEMLKESRELFYET